MRNKVSNTYTANNTPSNIATLAGYRLTTECNWVNKVSKTCQHNSPPIGHDMYRVTGSVQSSGLAVSGKGECVARRQDGVGVVCIMRVGR